MYPRGGLLVVAPLAAGARPLQWRAHDAPILAVDWSPAADRIASGGEDAIYKVGRHPAPLKGDPPFRALLHAEHTVRRRAL